MFSDIKKAWNEARGARLEQELTDAFVRLQGSNKKIYGEIYKNLAPMYEKVQESLFNMTPDGQIAAGKGFQQESRKKIDFDMGQGYALWIIGVWMESAHLPGQRAKKVHSFLNNFLSEMRSKFPAVPHAEGTSIKVEPVKINAAMDILVMQMSIQLGMGNMFVEA